MVLLVPDGCEHYPSEATSPEIESLVQRFAFSYGETYASYVAAESGWETFWAPQRQGVVRFVRWCGRYVISVGLLAPPAAQEELLAHFTQFLQLNNLSATFMNIARDQLPLFRQQGCQVTKAGEEPVVRLETATWQGKEFEWVRRQENFCLRQGLELVEINPDPTDSNYVNQIVPQLIEISNEHIAGTVHGREMRYFVGRFTPFAMGHRRLFVARNNDQIEAFIVCNPCLDGTMWAIEMYRRREDATRGIIPFAVLQTMRQLQREGVPYCSLSLIPMVRCDNRREGDSFLVQGTYYLWWRYGNFLYDVQGMYHFKSRFRPEYREIFIVNWKRASILSLIGTGWMWGVIRVNPLRLLSRWCQQLWRTTSRKVLAAPERRPERLLRRLQRSPISSSETTSPGKETFKPNLNCEDEGQALAGPSRSQAP